MLNRKDCLKDLNAYINKNESVFPYRRQQKTKSDRDNIQFKTRIVYENVGNCSLILLKIKYRLSKTVF